jgi:hypothetical protein
MITHTHTVERIREIIKVKEEDIREESQQHLLLFHQ